MSTSRSRTSRRVFLALSLLLFAAFPGLVRAQNARTDTTQHAPLDTTVLSGVPEGQVAVQRTGADTGGYHPTKLPWKAMLFSAVIPGAGQLYNESYWKVPIVVGVGVYLAYNWVDNNRLYHEYRDKYKAALEDPNADPFYTASMLSNREFYKDQRDSFTWYFLIFYFIQLADAYVDASLYDFNVGSDLSLRTLPLLSPVPVREVQLKVHIGF